MGGSVSELRSMNKSVFMSPIDETILTLDDSCLLGSVVALVE